MESKVLDTTSHAVAFLDRKVMWQKYSLFLYSQYLQKRSHSSKIHSVQVICTLFWYTFGAKPYIIYPDSGTEIEMVIILKHNKKGQSGDNKKEDGERE